MEWKVGDIAICVNVGAMDSSIPVAIHNLPPLKLNAEYVVQDVRQCGCGELLLDVGIASIVPLHICGKCRRYYNPNGSWWCRAKRFVKKDTRSKEEKLEEALKEENYELAVLIRDGV